MTHFQLALVGRPIKQSLSPWIHEQFAKQYHLKISYDLLEAEPGEIFHDIASKFFEHGGHGLNITLPFKVEALHFAQNISDRAKLAGACNTLSTHQGIITADNTDGAGFIHDIKRHHPDSLTHKRVVILGAGGAVRGILHPLIQQHPQSIIIANRTLEKAKQLAKAFSSHYPQLCAVTYAELADTKADVVIDGTSLHLQALPLPSTFTLAKKAICYDLKYAKKPTPTMQWAMAQSCEHIHDGFGMLVEQAAESFFLWTGQRPAVEPVIHQYQHLT